MPGNDQTPSMIKCTRCRQVKNKAAFSAKNLAQLVNAMRGAKINPKVDERIACIACSGHKQVELECAHCGRYKDLEKFSKRQRSYGDDAMCMQCIQEQLDTEPADPDDKSNSVNMKLEDSDDDDDDEDVDGGDDYSYSNDQKSSTTYGGK